jgi:ABC-2 type transport system permease protein
MAFFDQPVWQLTIARWKEFFREPIAIFWTYGFPFLLALILGFAFMNRPVEKIPIAIQNDASAGLAAAIAEVLKNDPRLDIEILSESEARNRLRIARIAAVVVPKASSENGYEYVLDPNRPESVLARAAIDNAMLKKRSGLTQDVKVSELNEPGGRYIDFLIPGLIGTKLLGGGLFGVGFAIVDLRIRKLLKRYLATPMLKRDFFLSLLMSRVSFTILEILVFLLFSKLLFKIDVRGNWLALATIVTAGAACFSGLGFLIASRAKTMETAMGFVNLIMLPSYLFCGVFFSSKNFPEWAQPIISKLPLTALNDGLRAVINDGGGFAEIGMPLVILAFWTIVTYVIAARLFRWLT